MRGSAEARRSVKRCVDVVGAAIGLAALSPVIAGIAVAIRIVDGRPILFVQRRRGLDGRPFDLVKFRTMTDARDATGGPLPDDARITSLGRWLRRYRLDELPELYNVLVGDMSIVGPRPLPPEAERDGQRSYRLRHRVRPGLTGLSQVSGNTLLRLDEKVALDNWYIDRWSLRTDLAIVRRTLDVLLHGEAIDTPTLNEALAHELAPDRNGGEHAGRALDAREGR